MLLIVKTGQEENSNSKFTMLHDNCDKSDLCWHWSTTTKDVVKVYLSVFCPSCLSVCLSVYPPFLHVTFFFCLSKIIFDYFAIYWHFLFQLRFQKCVDAHPEIMQKVATTEQEKTKEKPDKEKDKVSKL